MEVTRRYLLDCRFEMMGKNDSFEFLIKQYEGYHDFVFFNVEHKRLVIQYHLNQIELVDCDVEKANAALKLIGLPSIDKLKPE